MEKKGSQTLFQHKGEGREVDIPGAQMAQAQRMPKSMGLYLHQLTLKGLRPDGP